MSETTATEAPAVDEPDTGAPAEPDWKAEAEKFKALARKHEDRAKSNASAASELEKLKAATLTDTERAVAEAKAAGRAEALAESRAALASAELRATAAGRLPAGLLEAIDTSRFITADGDIDAVAIEKFVADNAPTPTADDDGKPPFVDFGQGKRANAAASGDPLLAEINHKLGIG